MLFLQVETSLKMMRRRKQKTRSDDVPPHIKMFLKKIKPTNIGGDAKEKRERRDDKVIVKKSEKVVIFVIISAVFNPWAAPPGLSRVNNHLQSSTGFTLSSTSCTEHTIFSAVVGTFFLSERHIFV